MAIPMAKLRMFLELHDKKKAIKRELEGVQGKLDALEEEMRGKFVEEGVQSMSVDGKCLYLHRQLWASVPPENRAAAVALMDGAGFGDLLTINAQQLSAVVREQLEGVEIPINCSDLAALMPGVPAELRGLIRVTEKFAVHVRNAG